MCPASPWTSLGEPWRAPPAASHERRRPRPRPASVLVRDRADVLDRVYGLAVDVDRASVLVSVLVSALNRVRVSALVNAVALVSASVLVSVLARALARNPSVRRQPAAVRVAPTAGRLLAATARLLPAADRARYGEEYRAELSEIAHTGAGRRSQLAYAARQLTSVWRLRAELRAPRQRGAAP